MVAEDFHEPSADGSPRWVILIVEDEILIRMILAEAFRHAGYEVLEAADADEAVSVLDVSPTPHVLITDVRMPGAMDGLALAAYVRKSRPTLKVIVTSGHAGPEGALDVADAFLAKPYDLERIVGTVRALTASP